MGDVTALLPSRIKVGPFVFPVEKITAARAEADKMYGSFSNIEHVIRVLPDRGEPAVLLDTLLHEIGHAIWWTYGLGQGDVSEERAVSTNATAWTQVMIDNPELRAFIEAVAVQSHASMHASMQSTGPSWA